MKVFKPIIILFILSKLLTSCCIPERTKFELSTRADFRIIKIDRTKIWDEKNQGDLITFTRDTLQRLSKNQKNILKNKLKNATTYCLLIKPGRSAATSYLIESNGTRVFVRNTNIIDFKGGYYRSKMYFFCENIFKRKCY